MKIQDAYISFENLKLKVNGEYVYFSVKDLIGMNFKGFKTETKRVRKWLVKK